MSHSLNESGVWSNTRSGRQQLLLPQAYDGPRFISSLQIAIHDACFTADVPYHAKEVVPLLESTITVTDASEATPFNRHNRM